MTDPEDEVEQIFRRNEANILVTYDLLSARINVATLQGGAVLAEEITNRLIKKVRASQKALHRNSVRAIVDEQVAFGGGDKFKVEDAQ